MKNIGIFNGFNEKDIKFLSDISKNNNITWFHDNRDAYEQHFLKPAFDLINVLGDALKKYVKDIVYMPKINGSLFRLNRDVRYSKNKNPYKCHMGLVFWKGPYRERHYNPGFYFHLEPYRLFLACGSWFMEKELLFEYRNSLLHKEYGSRFKKIVTDLDKNNIFVTSEHFLKKFPKGFDSSCELGEYSKYKGIYTVQEDVGALPDVIYRKELVDYCMAFYSKSVDLVEWLCDMTLRAFKRV